MSDIAIREALDGGDLDTWAQYEQAHNHIALGANTRDLFVSAGTLYLRKGKIGLYDGTQYYVVYNAVDRAISLAGLTASCWAKLELSVVGGNVVTTVTSIAGDTNPSKIPATFEAAYDPNKGGYYIASTKRCVGVFFLDATSAVASIINALSPAYKRSRTYDSPFPLFCAMPWFKNLAARAQVPLFTGNCNADVSMALKNTAANFTTVAIGDIVQNATSLAFATVLYKIGTDTLMLDADIFPAGNEAYKVFIKPVVSDQHGMKGFIELTGALLDGNGTVVADNDTLNHLKNSTGTVWTGLVTVGSWAMNLATGKVAQVTVVGAHDLTLQWDAFPAGNEKYMIFANTVTIADVESPLNGVVIPEMNISGRYFGGGVTPGNAEDDSFMAHFHNTYAPAAGGAVSLGAAGGLGVLGVLGTPPQAREAVTDGTNGTPRTGDHTQPRTLRATMVMRIK